MLIKYDCEDIFALPRGEAEAVCVTTNGVTKKDGSAVMGRGIALEADQRFHVAGKLGEYLSRYGNRAFNLGRHIDCITGARIRLLTYPTKHDWRDGSDLGLIEKSARELVAIADKLGLETVYMTRPGCGCGGLNWHDQVWPAIAPILDDRFVVADRAMRNARYFNIEPMDKQ